jgi:glycosyltransferase involved in cell wall biosynthesis
MRIAQIAPLAERCPPLFYGGTERIVSFLTEELVAQGHDVTLFASGDSVTSANLVPCAPKALRLDPGVRDPLAYHFSMLEEVRRRAHEFDVVHFHIDYLHFPMSRDFVQRTITTLHGRLDMPDVHPLFAAYSHVPLSSISHFQRKPMPPGLNWAANVYHGLPQDLLPYSAAGKGGYLAFLGRISPEKRPDRAIEIAVRAGLPLVIAAKIDKVDRDYWHEKIEPMVRANRNVEYIGEIDEQQKAEFLGNAGALLFPIDWPEPFGLVMIEAMACGTPVLAFRNGSVPEIIDPGVTGMVVDTIDEAVGAIPALVALDRKKVRERFDARFTCERMATDYVSLYHGLEGVRLDGARMRRAQGGDRDLHVVA